MEEIIAPIDKEVLKSELTQERRLRFTNKSNNEIYVVTAHNAPNVNPMDSIVHGILQARILSG